MLNQLPSPVILNSVEKWKRPPCSQYIHNTLSHFHSFIPDDRNIMKPLELRSHMDDSKVVSFVGVFGNRIAHVICSFGLTNKPVWPQLWCGLMIPGEEEGVLNLFFGRG